MESMNKLILEICEVVKVVDLTPIAVPDDRGEDFKYRVEIIKKIAMPKLFFARVWRRETFRLRPSFPCNASTGHPKKESWDEEILIKDIAYEWEQIRAKTPEMALARVLQKIRELHDLNSQKAGKKRFKEGRKKEG